MRLFYIVITNKKPSLNKDGVCSDVQDLSYKPLINYFFLGAAFGPAFFTALTEEGLARGFPTGFFSAIVRIFKYLG